MAKWDLNTLPPTRIYVTEGQLTPRGWSKFMTLLESVNREEIPKMFGNRLGPLPIETGPLRAAKRTTGAIGIEFEHGGAGAAIFCPEQKNAITACEIHQNVRDFDTDEREKEICCNPARWVISHELFHCAYAHHVPVDLGDWVTRGVMNDTGNGGVLSVSEHFASWLVYHPDTHPGNKFPDTNPTYR